MKVNALIANYSAIKRKVILNLMIFVPIENEWNDLIKEILIVN